MKTNHYLLVCTLFMLSSTAVSAQYGVTRLGDHALFNNTTGTSNTALGYYTLYTNTTGYNNTASGALSLYYNTTGYSNTAHGLYSLFSNTTGTYNTASGHLSLFSNISGSNNTASGYQSMFYNTYGIQNTAFGTQTLYHNTAGYYNAASGYASLYANTTGYSNTAAGAFALSGNTTGYYNTAAGCYALYANTAGNSNVASGFSSLGSNTTGNGNVAGGAFALNRNTTGNNNVAIGNQALYTNSTAAYNVGIGYNAMYATTTGNVNTSVGYSSMYTNTTGYYNTSIGANTMYASTTGSANVAIGNFALYYDTTGNNNTAVGYSASVTRGNLNNTIAIGYNALVDASSKAVIGSTTMTSIGGYVGWTTYPSDGRFKQNVKENVPGLAFINTLRPVTYTVDVDAIEAAVKPQAKKSNTEKLSEEDAKAIAGKKKTLFTGFIAQEVKKAAKDIRYDFSGVDTTGSIWGLRYADFVVPLVKSVQELSRKNDSLTEDNKQLSSVLSGVLSRLSELEKEVSGIRAAQQDVRSNSISNGGVYSLSSEAASYAKARLFQNVPNPFSSTTRISYYLPESVKNAKLVITNSAGLLVSQVILNTTGKGFTDIDAGTLAAGTYMYSLFSGDTWIDSKKMILTK